MKTIEPGQNEPLKDDFQLPHQVCVRGEYPKWRKKFNTCDPMLIMVRSGLLTIWRNGSRYFIRPSDVVLLAPGSFELEAFGAMRHDEVNLEYAQFPVSLLTRIGCAAPEIEEMALNIPEDESGVFAERRMLWTADFLRHQWLQYGVGVEAMLTLIVNKLPKALFPFLRSVYFKKRWALQTLLESHVLHPKAVEYLSSNYVDGRSAFFRDCKALTDYTPRNWVVERRMQLARVWMDGGGKPVAEVASVLHYGNFRRFRRDYQNRFGCPPGSEKSAQLFEMARSFRGADSFMRPFWWPAPLPLLWAKDPEAPEPSGSLPETEANIEETDNEPAPWQEEFKKLPIAKALDPEVSKAFWEMKPPNVSKIIPFPDVLPLLLKAA